MKKTPQTLKIEKAILPTVESMGYELVRILMIGVGSGTPTLQIMAEKPDGTMDVEDCSRLSQAISAILDVEDIIAEAYNLELSSPGLDRPLTRAKDFDLHKDNDVRIEMDTAISGQKKFKGMLKGLDGKNVVIESEDGTTVNLPLEDIFKAKLQLTDALLKKAMEKSQPKKEPKYPTKRKTPQPKAKPVKKTPTTKTTKKTGSK